MARRFVALTSASVLALGVSGPGPASAAERPGHTDARILQVMKGMSLEEKVGQLFVLQVYGRTADTADSGDVARNRQLYGTRVGNAEQLIAEYQPGGIIYYSVDPPNVAEPRQVAALSNGIQRAAMKNGIPVQIATDQEQGSVVTRIPAPFTQFPGAQALAAGRRVQDAHRAATITGRELRAIGINQDYAPDSDVNTNPANPVIGVRSFGSDPSLVAAFASAQVDGYRSANVIPTAKHFPGHGDAAVDSHTGVPEIKHTKEEWQRLDLPPFTAGIAHGVDSIMTAHIVVKSLDPSGDPATLSRPILTGILRDQLHYDGVVVTDALDMQGVRDKYGDDRVPVLALRAGADQLLKPPPGLFEKQFHAVLGAVASGELSERRINESVYRILRLKMNHGLFRHPYVDVGKVDQIVGTRAHRATEQRITDRTTTLVKNRDLPLRKNARNVFVTGWGEAATTTLAADIARRGPKTSSLTTGARPSQAQIDQAAAKARKHDVTVVLTYRAWDVAPQPGHNGPGQRNLVKALISTGKPVIAVAVRDAYDIGHFTEAPNYLATYSSTPAALESLTRVLFGAVNPRGRLPVTIPAADDPSRPLYPFGHGLGYRK